MKLMADSGAHSLFNKYIKHNSSIDRFAFFESDIFWSFVDEYCAFILENKDLIDVYVGVDVILNPELTWKVQKYMEKKGLSPLPVFHIGEDFVWLKKYIDNYDYIGMGGLGQQASKANWKRNMGDIAWRLICDEKTLLPRVKVHGFAMTSPSLVIEYPFFSVDSSSWMQFGKYGLIIVPKKKGKKLVYDESPTIVKVSSRKKAKEDEQHFNSLSSIEKTHILNYLESKGVPFGDSSLEEVEFTKDSTEFRVSSTEISSKEIFIDKGVCNSGEMRDLINLEYYLDLQANIPPYPRPWKRKEKILMRFPL